MPFVAVYFICLQMYVYGIRNYMWIYCVSVSVLLQVLLIIFTFCLFARANDEKYV